MIFIVSGILLFGCMMATNLLSERIEYKKTRAPSIHNRIGEDYESDRSRHPE